MEITRTHTSKLETLIRHDLYQSTYPTAVQGEICQLNLRMPYFDLLLAESTCRKGGETFFVMSHVPEEMRWVKRAARMKSFHKKSRQGMEIVILCGLMGDVG